MKILQYLILGGKLLSLASVDAAENLFLRGGSSYSEDEGGVNDEEISRFVNIMNSIGVDHDDEVIDDDGGEDEHRYVVVYHVGSPASRRLFEPFDDEYSILVLPEDHAEVRIIPTQEELQEIEARDDVAYVERDQKVYLQQQNSEETPYGIDMVKAINVPQDNVSNRKVCIIDTGYDRNHPDLPSGSSVTGVAAGRLDWFEDGNSHGTHVAGTIAAVGGNGKGVVGVMSNGEVGLHIVRVFNDEGRFVWASGLVAAVEECVKAGSNVVNMSLGGGAFLSFENTAYKRIFEDDNVLLVAAAGNGGNTAKSFPASYDAIISVAAVDGRERLASFSQRNNQVELAAPGVAVLSTTPGDDYKQYSGTSMACPHVAGVAALVWSSFPEKSAREIRQALQASAKDLGTSGKDNSYGYGLVDAERAYTYLSEGFTLSPTATPTTCNDVSGWENTRGRDCDWFAANDAWRCFWYGGRFEKDGFTGNDACCACGGGNQGGGGDECVDEPGWDRGNVLNCAWYTESRCRWWGGVFYRRGVYAKDACCVCREQE